MNFFEQLPSKERDKTSLALELETYAKNKDKLLAESKDKHVLIKGKDIIGVFSSYDDALNEGYKRFGNETFLVQKITEFETINYITRLTTKA